MIVTEKDNSGGAETRVSPYPGTGPRAQSRVSRLGEHAALYVLSLTLPFRTAARWVPLPQLSMPSSEASICR